MSSQKLQLSNEKITLCKHLKPRVCSIKLGVSLAFLEQKQHQVVSPYLEWAF